MAELLCLTKRFSTMSSFRKLDVNKTKWRLFTFRCDTLEAAFAWLQRCHVDSEENSKIPQRKDSSCFLIWFESNIRAWWRVLGLKCFSGAADRLKTAANSRAAEATGAVQQLCWKQTSWSKIRSNPLSIEASEKLKSHKPECCSQSASLFQSEPFIQSLEWFFFFS